MQSVPADSIILSWQAFVTIFGCVLAGVVGIYWRITAAAATARAYTDTEINTLTARVDIIDRHYVSREDLVQHGIGIRSDLASMRAEAQAARAEILTELRLSTANLEGQVRRVRHFERGTAMRVVAMMAKMGMPMMTVPGESYHETEEVASEGLDSPGRR